MRLLFLSTAFPNPYELHRGTYNVEMLRGLGCAHHVRVVAPVPWWNEWAATRRAGVRISSSRTELMEGWTVDYPRFFYPPKILRNSYGRFLWHSAARTIRRVVEEHRPQVVIGYWAHPDGEVAVKTARLAGAASVMMVGGSDVLLLTKSRSRRTAILNVLRSADHVVAVSENIRNVLLRYDLPPDGVSVVYRGVDRERFAKGDKAASRRRLGIPPDQHALVWVGNMVAVKRLDVLVGACAVLRGRDKPFHLYLIGDGPERQRVEALINQLRLRPHVTLVGAVHHASLGDWYRAASACVLSSDSEGIPNVLLESIACGTPFAATRVGGITEIADAVLDRLADAGCSARFADAVESLLAAKAGATKRRFEPWSKQEAVAQLERIFTRVSGTMSREMSGSHAREGRGQTTHVRI